MKLGAEGYSPGPLKKIEYAGGAGVDKPAKEKATELQGPEPREWFLVPLPVIDEAIQKPRDGTIGGLRYESKMARLTES